MEELLEDDYNIIAVIVAIEDYRFSESNGISKVKYAEKDANEIRNTLINCFGVKDENITYWVDKDATKTALEEELPYLIRQLTHQDKLMFYYAGHGFFNNGTNRLTVWESHINNLYGTTVSLNEVLLNPLEKSHCKRSLIFLDTCSSYLSENVMQRDLISSMNFREFESFVSTAEYCALFCSCSPGEKSYPSSTIKHGIWTWHLIEALRGNVKEALFKERYITSESLRNYLSKAVPEFINNKTTIKNTQTPFTKISSTKTFIIRQIPPDSEDETS